jgi:hypothetical protein
VKQQSGDFRMIQQIQQFEMVERDRDKMAIRA